MVSAGFRRQGPQRFVRGAGFPYWTAGALLRGGGRYRSQGRELDVGAMSLQLVRPGTPYQLERDPSAGAWIEAWVVFAPKAGWSPMLAPAESIPGIHSSLIADHEHAELLTRTLRDLLVLSRSPGSWTTAFVENSVERLLLLAMGRSGGPLHGPPVERRVRDVVEAMQHDCARVWTVADLARVANLSASRFAHAFTEQMGEPPLRYLARLRVERAKELLVTTSLPVSSIGRMVGYPDPMHFSSRFKGATRISPSRFRGGPGTARSSEAS